jgi:hypothetical protein
MGKPALRLDELRLLAEVGTLASARGDVKRARVIFAALEECVPAEAAPYMGLAFAQIVRRRWDDAVHTLDRGLLLVVPSHQATLHAVRAFALRYAGRASECERSLVAAGDHPLALSLLERTGVMA